VAQAPGFGHYRAVPTPSSSWTETWSGLPGMASFLEEYGPMKSTRLGGDIEFLYGIEPLWPDGTDPFPPTDLRINGHTTNG